MDHRHYMNIFEGVIKIKSLLRYPGSKWRIASWILSYFPEHRSYLEPFVGSGAVFFSKQRSDIETINDLDGDVVNLFYWVKHDPEKLAHEVYYTPYARQIYDNYNSLLKDWHKENKMNYSQAGSKKQEVLWMNFEPPAQLSIFDLATKEDKAK